MKDPEPLPVNRVRDLFWEALDVPTAAERAALLEQRCAGDATLRRQVEVLLENHLNDGFLERPALDPAARPGTPAAEPGPQLEQPGDCLGPYRLLERIGEGGVGLVFVAEQTEPIRRRVAVKVIKPGMDSRAVMARFETERQALARMDHPYIARVFDAGATTTGRPYFVMELVEGTRITDYCDRHQLSIRDRLRLFIRVCQAIQHAHQKGIVHRDIKPSNILVTAQDGVAAPACPKVIDFGIAKAIDRSLEHPQTVTHAGAFVGTPAYMSPEQAGLGQLDIDTRSDVYSLGVLLYELLTGSPPFPSRRRMTPPWVNPSPSIEEADPEPPSTRLRRQTEAGRSPGVHPGPGGGGRVVRTLRGDLDWIVLKALETDRDRRYETANALAMDVQRHLDNEPVLARPPSRLYRLRKLVRRHAAATAATAAFVLALAIGLTIATGQYLEKTAAYERALFAERGERRMREEAVHAQRLALAEAFTTRRRAHAANINLAQEALRMNNLGRARELLAQQRPGPGREDLRGWEWRYLWEQCRSDARFVLCHRPHEILGLGLSSDARWVAIAERAGRLSLWDLEGRSELAALRAAPGRLLAAFSPGGSILAYNDPETGPAWRPDSIRLYDVERQTDLTGLRLESAALGLAFAPDGQRLLTVCGNGEAAWWSVPAGAKLDRRELSGPWTGRTPVAISPDLRALAIHRGQGRLALVDLETGQERWNVQAAEEHVATMTFSPDGHWLASGGGYVESAIRLWSVASGREVLRLEGHRTWVTSIVFWPDGRTLASGSGDQTIKIWELEPLPAVSSAPVPSPGAQRPPRSPVPVLHPLATLRGHELEVWSLALAPDGRTLVSGSKDGTVAVWDVDEPERRPTYTTLPTPVRAWSFAGESLITLDPEGRLERRAGPTYQESVVELQLDGRGLSRWRPFGTVFSADGHLMAEARPEGILDVWETGNGRRLQELHLDRRAELPVGFLPGSRQLATYHWRDHTFRLWDLTTGLQVGGWPGHPVAMPLANVAVSPGGRWWILLDSNGHGILGDRWEGTRVEVELGLTDPGRPVFSSDDRHVAVVGASGMGALGRFEPSLEFTPLRGFLQGLHSAAFSRDGRRLAIGSNGLEAVKIWDVESGHELLTLAGRGSIFSSIAFSPDDRCLAAANSQGILHLWLAPLLEEIEAEE